MKNSTYTPQHITKNQPDNAVNAAQTAAENTALAAALRGMPDDPVSRNLLTGWQATAADAIEALIRKVAAQLTADALTASCTSGTSSDGYNVFQAATRARRQEAIARECRTLAENIVFSSLCHLSDPHWDPLVPALPAASTAPPDNLMTTLLDMTQEQAQLPTN